MKNSDILRQVKSVIAKECGIKAKSVTNKTGFMSSDGLPYFDCMVVLYTLQHRFNVSLPESDFSKYNTVGGLTKNIIRQLKHRSR